METGKTLQGTVNLAFDATHAVTHLVEGMYRNIAATPWLLGEAPEGNAKGIAGFVHTCIRTVNEAARATSNWCLDPIASELDRRLLPGPYREAAVSALNGICGDHLHKSGNTLAITMQLRVFLPVIDKSDDPAAVEDSECADKGGIGQAFTNRLETERRAVEVHPGLLALEEDNFSPTGNLLILVHGLSMNDREWTSNQHNHAQALAASGSYTPVYVLYNSGRNISTNGRELNEKLCGLLETWPTDVESITFIGFSMGGLVTRSAMHIAKEEGRTWLDRVDKAVYVGTPHHGATMERGGFWLQKAMTFSPYTAPLSALGRIRSDGITDLRHGNIQDDDWQHHDEHEDNADYRRPTPLVDGIEHYAIAGTLSKRSGDKVGRLLGDGLVHPSSATGRHENPEHDLAFPEGHTKIFYDLGHLAMLHDSRVMGLLEKWLLDDRG